MSKGRGSVLQSFTKEQQSFWRQKAGNSVFVLFQKNFNPLGRKRPGKRFSFFYKRILTLCAAKRPDLQISFLKKKNEKDYNSIRNSRKGGKAIDEAAKRQYNRGEGE